MLCTRSESGQSQSRQQLAEFTLMLCTHSVQVSYSIMYRLSCVTAAGEAEPGVGFFRNPNRFNVAITRAQALMVVLGHPLVLLQVPSSLP